MGAASSSMVSATVAVMPSRMACGGAFHGNANRIGPRGWVGLASNLANPPVDADAGGQPKAMTLAGCPIVRRAGILLGDGDGDFRFPGLPPS